MTSMELVLLSSPSAFSRAYFWAMDLLTMRKMNSLIQCPLEMPEPARLQNPAIDDPRSSCERTHELQDYVFKTHGFASRLVVAKHVAEKVDLVAHHLVRVQVACGLVVEVLGATIESQDPLGEKVIKEIEFVFPFVKISSRL